MGGTEGVAVDGVVDGFDAAEAKDCWMLEGVIKYLLSPVGTF